MNILLIVADLGRVKAYRITRDDDDPNTSPAFEDLADDDLENQHSRVSDRVTDQAGRVAYGSGSVALGERHHEEEEARTNQLKTVAERINTIAGDKSGSIHLAAPQPILRQLLDALDAGVRGRIRKSLGRDLVKSPKLDLLKRFDLA